MMDNGLMEGKKVMEYGREYMVIFILVNGKIQKLKDTECINGKMVTNMKENGGTV
jgi:hypothetical protein